MALAACVDGSRSKPDIPADVSPGWRLHALYRTSPPAAIPPTGAPDCWKAEYGGPGSANAWFCWYKAEASALDASQRAQTEAQTVKFQEGHYLVVVKWNNTPRASLEVLVRAIQRAVQPKK